MDMNTRNRRYDGGEDRLREKREDRQYSSDSRERSRIPMDPSRRQKTKSSFSIFGRKKESEDVDNTRERNDIRDMPDVHIASKPHSSENKVYNPIDYKFPSREITSNTNDGDPKDDEEKLPKTGDNEEQLDLDTNPIGIRPMPQYASARKDAIARYSSTSLGKLKLAISTYLVGGAIGGFIGKSMLNQGGFFVIMSGFLFLTMSFLRNDYGEMSRSLGLGLIYLVRRTKYVRRRYKTGAHIRGMCRFGPRKPFPPVFEGEDENPWRYAPQSREDPDFEMVKALLCMILIGSFCGGNVPLIPTSVGAASGAAAFGILGIAKNARGDLIRTMGMKVVALIGEAMVINSELKVARKVATVGGKIFDKMMILDRKHRIKDRIVKSATWAYEQVSNTAARVQEDVRESRDLRDDRLDDDIRSRRQGD